MDIRLGKTDSIHSRNADTYSNFDVCQTTKVLPANDLGYSVDLEKVFNEERDACTEYRIVLTINPFCTNILFNSCTEIVKNEGGDTQLPILDTASTEQTVQSAIGKYQNIRRFDMVRNTEYSREGIGLYTYHPGMDIFNNHIIRNKTAKVVTRFNSQFQTAATRNVFNTLSDFFRDRNGSTITFVPRVNITTAPPSEIPKHMYVVDDVYGFENGESFINNVSEENGWVGFVNGSTIDAKGNDGNPMDVNRVMNANGNCDFIDLYPDRTLFSFSPKHNARRDRDEYNWDVELTYPYRNFSKHPLVREIVTDNGGNPIMSGGKYVFGVCHGLLLQYAKASDDGEGGIATMFRSYVKHHLVKGSFFNVYYRMNGGGTYERYSGTLMVSSLGDADRKNGEYYFSVGDERLYDEIVTKHCLELFYTLNVSPQNPTQYVEYTHIPEMIPSYQNDSKISYFVYVADSNPNPSYGTDETFSEIPYETYYTPNKIRIVDGVNVSYWVKVKRYYDFKTTIHSDSDIRAISLSAFNNSTFRIRRVVSGVESEYYFRIFRKIPNLRFAHETLPEGICEDIAAYEAFVEANATYTVGGESYMYDFSNEWYDLAFARTIYGDKISQLTYTDNVDINGLIDNLGRPLTEIYATVVKKNSGYEKWYGDTMDYSSDEIEYSHCFGKVTSGVPFLSTSDDRSTSVRNRKGFLSDARSLRNTDIGFDTDSERPLPLEYWIGKNDSVNGLKDNEFFGDIVDFNPVEAAETVLENVNFRFNTAQRESDASIGRLVMKGDELVSDDYDSAGFNVVTTDYVNAIIRPEGYIYEPHYLMQVRELSQVRQDSHFRVNVEGCEPVALEKIFLKITSVAKHGCSEGDEVYLGDDATDVWYRSVVTYVLDYKNFMVSVMSDDVENGIGLDVIAEKISSGEIVVRRRNSEIPRYAKNIGVNDFVWRDVQGVGNSKNNVLKEYPFTNGAFYIDTAINFYLKRQDPDGYNGLYAHSPYEIFNDVQGMTINERETDAVVEAYMVC